MVLTVSALSTTALAACAYNSPAEDKAGGRFSCFMKALSIYQNGLLETPEFFGFVIMKQQNRPPASDFICADANDAATYLKAKGMLPDVVVVDPPRKGLAPDVIDTIAALSPARVVYVSCDPATLARDLKIFEAKGFKAVEATAFDMFPRCAHVETVVLMSRVDKN